MATTSTTSPITSGRAGLHHQQAGWHPSVAIELGQLPVRGAGSKAGLQILARHLSRPGAPQGLATWKLTIIRPRSAEAGDRRRDVVGQPVAQGFFDRSQL